MEAPSALQPNDRELLYRWDTFQRNRGDREAAQQFIDSPDLLHLVDLAGIDREMAPTLRAWKPTTAPPRRGGRPSLRHGVASSQHLSGVTVELSIPYSVKFYHGGGQRDPALLAMSAAHLFFLISILE